jgi:hypothetical protein
MPHIKLSSDWWSVLVALFAAALVRLHLLPHIAW